MTKKYRFATPFLLCCVFSNALQGQDTQQNLQQSFQKIEQQQQAIQTELQQLKLLLQTNTSLANVQIQIITQIAPDIQLLLNEGIAAYQKQQYEEAKKFFYQAWEKAPDHSLIQFNLALTYYQIGNLSLAKKMFQSALKADPQLPYVQTISAFTEQKTVTSPTITKLVEESPELKALRTELLNKQKEINSYHKSNLSFPQRLRSVLKLLDEMHVQGQTQTVLMQEYFLWVAENYATFEYYDTALKVFKQYEHAMLNKELPDEYHVKKLQLNQQQQQQKKHLEHYLTTEIEPHSTRNLQKDCQELAIFATQMDQFVTSSEPTDPDFTSLCQRLKEFKWGRKSSRHVLVIDRYQNILFSSLPGTLPLDRYQDVKGNHFFQDITLLANQLNLKQVHCLPIDLQVNNNAVPYIILYTYIPKHEAFIIVRVLKADLNLS